jgi:hypothetical protein
MSRQKNMKSPREHFLSELDPILEAHPSPDLAAAGVRRLKKGYRITLNATYSSQGFDHTWDVNTEDEEILVVRLQEEGFDTIHKVAWEFYKGMSIEIIHSELFDSHAISEMHIRNTPK